MDSHNVLVVGGAGYIGSHTCKELSLNGFQPIVLDNLSEGHDWAVKFGPLEKGDAGDYEFVAKTIRKHQISSVLHFAANAYVGESVENPRKYIRNNVTAMDQLLGACIDTGVSKFIFSSSCATFGVPQYVPLNEQHPQNPISPYGDTKFMGERILHWYSAAYNFKYVALRYFNASGADPDGVVGEVHNPESHLIPLILQAILGKRKHIGVFGTDYDTPDGTAIRDYVHVKDLADAHVKALKLLIEGGESAKVNLGSGQGYSVQEVIDMAAKVTGRPVPVEYQARRAGDPPSLYADPTYAKQLLDWTPTQSDLETIIQTAWDWELKRESLGV
jgi:UDP-glucose-4-epimerase GalE